jgi:methionyl-tRNA formyltransferase
MKIIFMGTPDFAVPSLAALLEAGHEIVGVITAPDKPGGRKGVQESAVKQFALARGLRILQPEKLKNADFLAELRALQAALQVVVAFRMLPEVVWNMPPKGTLNLHGSLLPKYRGAAPINWAVINGETETGVTTFLLKHDIDTGDILYQDTVPIGPDETAGELHDRMMHIGAALVVKTVAALENNTAQPQPQPNEAATHAPKIFTETCRIDPHQPAAVVHNFVRGLSPYPGAWMLMDDKTVKILRTAPEATPTPPQSHGTWHSDGKNYLKISVLDGFVQVLELQMEGKKRMSARDFLNGFKYDAWATQG